jgi:transcriptional regulator with PAS, ATPase and Fis domain
MESQRSHTEPRADRASHHLGPHESESNVHHIVRVGDESIDLVSRAYDALDQGILVVSQDGLISHYNAAYAQLRNIGTTELFGKPLELLDRRNTITAYLRTGKAPSIKPVDYEQRRNQETVIPIRQDGRLLGSMVLVTQAMALPNPASQRRRTLNTSSPWTASYGIDDIVGDSPAMQYARQLALSAARVDSSVLLLGESGTGKELFAHAIHMASKRSQGPFVPVDCSAITRDLLEAELFGYAPGAFTGADKDGKPGKFELAEGGTVFLD